MAILNDYHQITRDMPALLKQALEEPVVSSETNYYLQNISEVKSIEDFLANDRLFSYAMKAHGLEEMIYGKGLMRKVLDDGTEDGDALVNKFTDPRYRARAFAEAFDFKKQEGNATISKKAGQGTVEKYLQQTLEENAGINSQGVRLALYFEREMPKILEANSSAQSIAFSILGDSALAEVVQTALSIPPETAAANIDQQADAIIDKIDFDNLKSPEGRSKFLEDFAALWQVDNSYSDPPSSALYGQFAKYGMSSDFMFSINKLKLGGH